MAKKENVHLRKDGRYEARYIKGRDDEGKLIYGFCYARSYEEAKKKAEEAHMAQGRTDPDIESTFEALLRSQTAPGDHAGNAGRIYADAAA